MEAQDSAVSSIDPRIDNMLDMLEKPMQFYQQDRLPDEMNLVTHVRELMIEQGLRDRVETAFDTHRLIIEAQGKSSHPQQFLLNRYFALQFMSCEKDTRMNRFRLIYEISPDQWLGIFRTSILPALIDLDLPRPL